MKANHISAHELHAALTRNLSSKGHVFGNNDLQGSSGDLNSLVSVHAGATFLWVIGKTLPYDMLERMNDLIEYTSFYQHCGGWPRDHAPLKGKLLQQERIGLVYFDARMPP